MEPRFLLSGPSRPVIAIFELELGKSFGEKGWKVQRVLEHCRQLTWDIENLEAHEGVVIWWSPLLHCADVLVIPEKQHDIISCSYSYVHNANPTFDLSGWTDHSCRAKSWATSDELRSSIRSTRSRQFQPGFLIMIISVMNDFDLVVKQHFHDQKSTGVLSEPFRFQGSEIFVRNEQTRVIAYSVLRSARFSPQPTDGWSTGWAGSQHRAELSCSQMAARCSSLTSSTLISQGGDIHNHPLHLNLENTNALREGLPDQKFPKYRHYLN